MTTSAAPLPAAPLASDAGLTDLLQAFRQMQLQHGRVIVHESEALSMGATDIRALFFIASGNSDGATPKQVAEFLELSTGATTSLVDRLVNAGTLVRQAHPTDRRSVVLHVTEAGQDAVRHVADVYRCALSTAIPESAYTEMAALFRSIALALTEGSGCFSTEK
ncbi:MarR family winged helix-turn-helix transcriptional regulator [Frondihabitans australicus]|uniref:DNA-binding MarR family transcriptional regulator n=1 Tax=Frondihabitans australicus TaxID=386892 RepID=A0A495IK96_9MICO|nr:MarR family transcriptional regulator [Frondihabitans australicus]RKR76219.1 DNA-binding MarR family transcriptional regulator [Frondihabitans australicus]